MCCVRTLIALADRLRAAARRVRALGWFAWCVLLLVPRTTLVGALVAPDLAAPVTARLSGSR